MDQELTFIRQALPEDWDSYPQSLFEAFAAHSHMLRQTVPWCASLSSTSSAPGSTTRICPTTGHCFTAICGTG